MTSPVLKIPFLADLISISLFPGFPSSMKLSFHSFQAGIKHLTLMKPIQALIPNHSKRRVDQLDRSAEISNKRTKYNLTKATWFPTSLHCNSSNCWASHFLLILKNLTEKRLFHHSMPRAKPILGSMDCHYGYSHWGKINTLKAPSYSRKPSEHEEESQFNVSLCKKIVKQGF